MNPVARLAASIGKGLFAGAVGTAAMTVSSSLEMKLRDREASSAPADAAGIVLGVEPRDEEGKERFSNVVHLGYGTGWGAARGVLGFVGLSGPAAAVAHMVAVWGSELVMLPKLGVTPPPSKWGGKELGVDLMHHATYAVATSIAYQWLDRTE